MPFTFSEKNNVQILTADNLWDPEENLKMTAAVNLLISEDKHDFIIDLSTIPYINSIGLSFLISILTRARSAGGDVLLCGISENTKQLLLLTRLHNMFMVSATIDEALEHFQLSKA